MNSLSPTTLEAFTPAKVLGVDRGSRSYAMVSVQRPSGFDFRPAQVAELRASGEAAFYALASAPADPELLFVVKRPESSMAAFAVGQDVEVRGPHGKGYAFGAAAHLAFCGIGSAYGALRSGLRHALACGRAPQTLTIIIGMRRWADLPAPHELVGWAERGVRVCLSFSAPGDDDMARARHAGLRASEGRLYAALDTLEPLNTLAMLAGSDEAEAALTAGLVARGLSLSQIQCNFRPDYRDPP